MEYDLFYEKKYNNKWHKRFHGKYGKSKKRVKGTVKKDVVIDDKMHNMQCFYFQKNHVSLKTVNGKKSDKDKGVSVDGLDRYQKDVFYSINKGKRWEMIDDVAKKKKILVFEHQSGGRYAGKTEILCTNLTKKGVRLTREKRKRRKGKGKGKGRSSSSEKTESKSKVLNGVLNAYKTENEHRKEDQENQRGSKGSRKRKKKQIFSKGGKRDKGVKYRQRSEAPLKQRPEKEIGEKDYDLLHNSEEVLVVEKPLKNSGLTQRGCRGYSPEWRGGGYMEKNHIQKGRQRFKNHIKTQMDSFNRGSRKRGGGKK